ncbi:MAG: class I SAM-dependent methyltransferase, partial [Gemmatimonadetes bacterium]|nr:class I SAM-dependent methyltransferase [Gemmatimonadota bacterium]
AEGVETDPAVVAQCRARGLTVTEGNLESAAFPSDTFDAIALKHVIEHVPNPGGLLKECRRILKPGGRVVILTPNLVSAGHRALAAHWLGLEVPRHLVVFNRGALVGLANRAGLRLLEARSSSRPSSFIWVISDTLRRQDQNAYFVPASKMVRLRAALFAAGVWLRLLWNADAGDELMVVLTK